MAERKWLARFLGRWLTALAADGCWVNVMIFPGEEVVIGGDEIAFAGKWTSRPEPISTDFVWTGSRLQKIDRFAGSNPFAPTSNRQ